MTAAPTSASSVIALDFTPIGVEDVAAAHQVEEAGFPADEAASLETMKYRQRVAGEYFLGARSRDSSELVGFVSSTLTSSPTLTHDSMSTHDPSGTTLAVHSVCVSLPYRRKGVASSLLKEYLHRVERGGKVRRVALICHEELLGLYASVGFVLVGKSEVQHGAREWYEMRVDFARAPAVPSDPGALAALLASSTASSKGPSTLFEESTQVKRGEKGGVNTNDVVCPVEGCGCIIFKAGAATWAEDVELKAVDIPSLPPSTIDSPSASATGLWSLSNPLAFENIAFSRPAPSSQPSALPAPARFLGCGACEVGPIGFLTESSKAAGSLAEAVDEGEKGSFGRGFWVLPDRVRYRS